MWGHSGCIEQILNRGLSKRYWSQINRSLLHLCEGYAVAVCWGLSVLNVASILHSSAPPWLFPVTVESVCPRTLELKDFRVHYTMSQRCMHYLTTSITVLSQTISAWFEIKMSKTCWNYIQTCGQGSFALLHCNMHAMNWSFAILLWCACGGRMVRIICNAAL